MRNLGRVFLTSSMAACMALALSIATASATSSGPTSVYYVTERFNEGIAKVTVDSSGTQVDTQFITGLPEQGPDSVIFDHQGNMLISNTDAQTISEINPSTKQVIKSAVNLVDIPGVADLALQPGTDAVWAIQWSGDTLARVSLTTGVTTLFHSATTTVSDLGGIAFSDDGRLFVSSHQHKVVELSPTTATPIRTGSLEGGSPDGMTFDPTTGHLFASGCSGICEFTLGTATAPALSFLSIHDAIDGDGIAADGHGHILVVGSSSLSSLDLKTDTVTRIATDIPSADDVAPVIGAGAPPPANISLTPATATHPVGETTKAVATVTDVNGNPVPNASVTLKVTGANARTLTGTTDASGQATFTYTGSKAGTDTLVATSGSAQSNSATVLWTAAPTATPSPPILAQTGTTPEPPLAFGKAFAGWLLLILGMVLFLARRRARS